VLKPLVCVEEARGLSWGVDFLQNFKNLFCHPERSEGSLRSFAALRMTKGFLQKNCMIFYQPINPIINTPGLNPLSA